VLANAPVWDKFVGIVALELAGIFRNGAAGPRESNPYGGPLAAVTVMDTGAEVDLTPALSVATAVNE